MNSNLDEENKQNKSHDSSEVSEVVVEDNLEAKEFIQDLLGTINEALDEKKAEDVEQIEVAKRTTLADYFVIATARNASHMKILSDAVEEKVYSQLGQELRHSEGLSERRWTLMDYGDVIVHIMRAEDRNFYNLESLWREIEE